VTFNVQGSFVEKSDSIGSETYDEKSKLMDSKQESFSRLLLTISRLLSVIFLHLVREV